MIFLSSVSRRFGPGSSSVELKYVKIIARFAYAMKEDIKNKNFVVRALKTKQVGNVFFAAWLPEKSDLSKVLKWRKLNRPLQLCLRMHRKKYTVQLNLDQNSSTQIMQIGSFQELYDLCLRR